MLNQHRLILKTIAKMHNYHCKADLKPSVLYKALYTVNEGD